MFKCKYSEISAKAVWLSGYSRRLRTERCWVRNPHRMLPPLVSQGDVVVPCKPELSGWWPLARVRGHGLVVKAICTWLGPCNSTARCKQMGVLFLIRLFHSNKAAWIRSYSGRLRTERSCVHHLSLARVINPYFRVGDPWTGWRAMRGEAQHNRRT